MVHQVIFCRYFATGHFTFAMSIFFAPPAKVLATAAAVLPCSAAVLP